MAEMISIDLAPNRSAEAYVARPHADGTSEYPGVLLLMDAFGLRPQIAAMADRIASWGYVVLAPNVFHQFGTSALTSPGEKLSTTEQRQAFFQSAVPRLQGLFAAGNREQLLADVRAYVAALHALPQVGSGPVGITGYCMGVRLSMLTAGELGDQVAAVGGFHGGGLVTDDPLSPHLALKTATAEFWFGHAENDGSNTPEQQHALAGAIADAELVHGAAQYPGAPHGYTMADLSSYHQPSAERHYDDLRALLGRTLDG